MSSRPDAGRAPVSGEKRSVRETFGEEETRAFGRSLGEQARPGEVYVLSGDLGTGKTVLAQGFAEGLGVRGQVSSPTFTILQVYRSGRLPFCHMDVYRLEEEDEFLAIGGDEFFGGEFVCLVEWGEQISGLIPEDALRIRLEKDPRRGPDYRRITFGKETEE